MCHQNAVRINVLTSVRPFREQSILVICSSTSQEIRQFFVQSHVQFCVRQFQSQMLKF